MLSEQEIFFLNEIYFSWPKQGMKEVTKEVLPPEYQDKILNTSFPKATELQALVRQWKSNGLESAQFEGESDDSLETELCGTVYYPILDDFYPVKAPGNVDLSMVKLSIKYSITWSFLVFLFKIIPLRAASRPPRDLYRTLKNPDSQPNMNFLCRWAFWCIRKHAILPEFGSVEGFIRVVRQYISEGGRFCQLIYCCDVCGDVDSKLLKKLMPNETGLHQLANIQLLLDHGQESLLLYYQGFIFDIDADDREFGQPWSTHDQDAAYHILRKFKK